jgi:hypothetical protein
MMLDARSPESLRMNRGGRRDISPRNCGQAMAAIGFPNASGTIPPENGMLAEILGELRCLRLRSL